MARACRILDQDQDDCVFLVVCMHLPVVPEVLEQVLPMIIFFACFLGDLCSQTIPSVIYLSIVRVFIAILTVK